MKRGLFIVFEGLDRTGKSTQARMLVERLNVIGYNAELMVFPNRASNVTGKIIDDYLKSNVELDDHCVHLLFSANRWEIVREMEDMLMSGKTIVCDRYSYSGAVYSMVKNVPGIDEEWCMACERGLLRPDIVFLFDGNVEMLALRGDYGSERYEIKDVQNRAASLFRLFAEKEKDWWQIIYVATMQDGNMSVDCLHSIVFERVLKMLQNKIEKDINFIK